jgi:hypothetical protein
MLRQLIDARTATCYCMAALVWTAGWFLMPFPESHPLHVYIHFKRPAVYQVFYWSYLAMWFTTPWFLTSMLLSLLYILTGRRDSGGLSGQLPPYQDPAGRSSLGPGARRAGCPESSNPGARRSGGIIKSATIAST